MKKHIIAIVAAMLAISAFAQESTNSGVRRRDSQPDAAGQSGPAVTGRMRSLYAEPGSSLSEGDVQWLRVIYRQLDLDKDENAALYFPEDLIDGQENMFRIILRLLTNGDVKAYEYLDGREIFTPEYQVNVKDMLERFYIPYEPAKGSSEKNPKYVVQESDVPTTEVLSYYVIERWEFDNRNNRLKTYVDAICPVLHRSGDFGGEPLKYPMFWVKFNDLRPYLAQQSIFVSDDNNLPSCTYDDFFNLTMYKGDIYKTRNLRNRSMMQMFPDPDDLARAQDSIQNRLDTFEDNLWVPNREDIIAAREMAEANDSTAVAPQQKKKSPRTARQSTRKPSKPKASKPKSESGSSSSGANRSVRRRR